MNQSRENWIAIMNSQNSTQNKQLVKNDEIDLIEVIKTIWNYRKLIFITTAAFAVGGIIYSLLATNYYKATVTFYKESPGDQNSERISSLASKFGFSTSRLSGSVALNIQDVLKSEKMAARVAFKQWKPNDSDSTNLIDFWGIESVDSIDLLEQVHALYLNMVSYRINETTGLIAISTIIEDRKLSADISNFIANEIDHFMRNEMKTQVSENTKYIAERLDSVTKELEIAENMLRQFEESNTGSFQSPNLKMKYARFQREVSIKEQVFTTLRIEYEKAQIELIKETPIINILDCSHSHPRRQNSVFPV
jgi:uncharacterized protein involved in exopolysaccharide biosynthesis